MEKHNMNTERLKDYLKMNDQYEVKHKMLLGVLTGYYSSNDIINHPDFIIAKGNIPIGLVAHMDTVFTQPPNLILYDERQQIMWSPQGLGADDRAGCFAIEEILSRGYRPTVILTTSEEEGCLGALSLVEQLPEKPCDLHFLIELDRRGINDAVYYDCVNPAFEEFITSFGFETDKGSYSDISILCPSWNLAGVNLSIGYFYEHSYMEMLLLDYLKSTIEAVCRILEADTQYYEYGGDLDLHKITCHHCQKTVPAANSIEIDGYVLCMSCFIDHCPTCKRCKNIYYNPLKREMKMCPTCRMRANVKNKY